MNHRFAMLPLVVLVCLLPLYTAEAEQPTIEPLFEMQEIYDGTRFPNIVVATDGTVLAFRAHNSPLQVRRSEDGGETWGPIIQVSERRGTMGAAVVDENTGDILVFDHFVEAGTPMYRSTDHGKTWEESPHEIKPDGFGGVAITHGHDSGITLRHGEHAGRLIISARVFGPEESNDRRWWPYHYNTAIFSDDGGRTWQTSHPFPVLGTGEASLVELPDGSIHYNSRMHLADDARRRVATSRDGGMTWLNPRTADDLPDGPRASSYGCMGGLTSMTDAYGRTVLIYSNLDEPSANRRRITVWASLDHGKTWPIKKLVYEGPSAYSSLTAGRPGTPSEGMIYLQFEGGEGGMYSAHQVARFNLAWVLQEQ